MIRAVQSRLARTGIGWSADDLADATGLAVDTVRRFERGANATLDTVTRIQTALEAQGVRFIETDEGVGVLLRKQRAEGSV